MNDVAVKEKAEERVTLKRGELWLLRLAAIGGLFSVVSHGASTLAWIFGWL